MLNKVSIDKHMLKYLNIKITKKISTYTIQFSLKKNKIYNNFQSKSSVLYFAIYSNNSKNNNKKISKKQLNIMNKNNNYCINFSSNNITFVVVLTFDDPNILDLELKTDIII